MKGFNYDTAQEFDLPVETLRADLQRIVDNGGRRRVENGETYAHGKDRKIIWEAYGNVTLKKSSGQQSLIEDPE
jgi:hypothetical protein